MKIIQFKGGLGNQMFQYAFGQILSGKVKYDLSWFEYVKNNSDVTQRAYELDFWNVNPEIAQTNDYKKYFGLFGSLKKITENFVNIYDDNLINSSKSGIYEGYFQVAQYYNNIREQLLHDFTPKQKINKENSHILSRIQSVNSVSIHVRRGDYLKLKHIHGCCDIKYYKKAIKYIHKYVDNPHFFVFSDDIEWSNKMFEKLKITFEIVDVNHGFNSGWDIWLMKYCKHNIIANSSFSWWGGWLNENEKKIVISPKQWFANGDDTDILPQEWIKL